MTTTAHLLKRAESSHLRPFDVSRDLKPVADLIERCFADTLDADGERYLRQMRSAARNPRFLRWAASVSEQIALPLAGYVWEENGGIVGNLSMIPLIAQGTRIYLFANVAVEPAYRRRGIARALTLAALDRTRRRRNISAVWLQVRTENGPAHHLYQSLGFTERVRRTTWHLRRDFWPKFTVPDVEIRPRRTHHWARQRAWLNRTYPPELSWNIPIKLNLLRPGLLGTLYRLLAGTRVRHWAALMDGDLLGVLSWQPAAAQADHLWLAAPAEGVDLAIRALMGLIQPALSTTRQLALDFPADESVPTLESVGFYPYQTLIWMELKIGEPESEPGL